MLKSKNKYLLHLYQSYNFSFKENKNNHLKIKH